MKHSTVRRPFRDKIIGDFIDQVQRNQKCHWASDLLSKGLTQDDIRQAMQRAMVSCKQSGLDVELHFQLTHIESDAGSSFDDCKLSKHGYLLTLINANPKNEYVALYQKQILKQYFQSINELIHF